MHTNLCLLQQQHSCHYVSSWRRKSQVNTNHYISELGRCLYPPTIHTSMISLSMAIYGKAIIKIMQENSTIIVCLHSILSNLVSGKRLLQLYINFIATVKSMVNNWQAGAEREFNLAVITFSLEVWRGKTLTHSH